MSERLEDELLNCYLGRYINPRTFYLYLLRTLDAP